MIDPRIWESEQFSRLSLFERQLYIGLISHADDEGRLRDHPVWIRSAIFPYDDFTVEDVSKALSNVQRVGLILRYRTDEWAIIQHPKWSKYQRVDKPQSSKYPAYTAVQNDSENGSQIDSESDSRLKEVKGKEVKKPSCPTAEPSDTSEDNILDGPQNTLGLSRKQFGLFIRFYNAYPRHLKKLRAARAWKVIKPVPDEALLGRMLESIEAMKRIPGWDREGMRFVLHPASWLNAGCWDDEPLQKQEESPKKCPICGKEANSWIVSGGREICMDCHMGRVTVPDQQTVTVPETEEEMPF